MQDDAIRRFLVEPVPPGGPMGSLESWKVRCRALGPRAPAIFMEALEHGSESEQYAALIGLREFGYSTSAEGYGREVVYRIKPPGLAELVIRPKVAPWQPE